MINRDAYVNNIAMYGEEEAAKRIAAAQNAVNNTKPVRAEAVAAPETTGSAYIDIPAPGDK